MEHQSNSTPLSSTLGIITSFFRSSLPLGAFLCLLLSLFLLNSCSKNQEYFSNPDSTNLITPRKGGNIWHDTIYELHNEYILWVFENYMDSAIYYANDPVDFLGFAARRNFEFLGVTSNYSDLLDNDTLIISHPYYIKNYGFTYQDIYEDWSNADSSVLHTALDSIYDAIENSASEGTIQQLISNGKSRVLLLSSDNEVVLINTLTQASYSISLMYELVDIYGSPTPIGFAINPCVLAGAMADVCTMALMNSHIIGSAFNDYPETQKMDLVREQSLYAFSVCFVDCG